MKYWWMYLLFFIPFHTIANDSIQGKWSVENKSIYLGQKFYIELEVKAPKSIQFELPNDVPTIKGAESIGQIINEQFTEQNSTIYKKRFHFIAFDSVQTLVNAIEIPYTVDQQQKMLKIESANIQVDRISVDSTDAIRAAYEPIAPVDALNGNIFFLVIGILVIIGALIAFLQWKKSKNKLSIPLDADPKEWALQQLSVLEEKIPFEQHSIAWVHLTEVVRLYMQRVWNIPAPHFSTGEVLLDIAKKTAYTPMLNQVAQLLELADQVKFAKENTTSEQQLNAIQLAKEIIHYQYIPSITLVKEEVLDE